MTALIKTSKPNGWLNRQREYTSPFSLLDEMLSRDLFASFGEGLIAGGASEFIPAVNISEQEKSYHLEFSAPGFSKEDFKVEVEDGTLVVSAEHKTENKQEEKKFSRREFSYGTFRRTFTLSDDSDESNISAKYENGILNITIPRREEAKANPSRQIVIG